jgi:hypothetical protein
MPKLTETYVKRISQTNSGTDKYWDAEIKGLVLYVGKKAKTWYFQKVDVSRFSAAPGSQLSSHTFESQWAFPS